MIFINKVFTLDYLKGTNRIDLYDFLRGVAMIIVMMQHASFPGRQFLLTFHMPLFFFLSGMVISGRELPSFGKYALNKFKRLMIPYFTFGFLTIAINYCCLTVFGKEYDILMAAAGIITGQYGFVSDTYSGIYWFLFVMFIADLIIYPINKYHRYNQIAILGGALFFLVLSYMTTHLFEIPMFTIDKAFMGATFILLGELCKPYTKYMHEAKFGWKEVLIIFLAISGVLISKIMNDEKVLMYLNQYGNYGWFMLGAVSGIVAVILISKNLYDCWSKNKRWYYNLVVWVGFNSLIMFPVHLMIKEYLGTFVSHASGSYILQFILMFVVGIPLCNFIINYMPWMLGMTKKK